MDNLRPWHGLPGSISPLADSLFHASTLCTIGDGWTTSFWTDRWLEGCAPKDFVPDLFTSVPMSNQGSSVRDALNVNEWTRHFRGVFSLVMIYQFCILWARGERIRVNLSNSPDIFRWIWTSSGAYSAASAYRAFFEGKTSLPGARQLWHSKAPLRVKFLGWLVLHNRCWTADRVQSRGHPHQMMCTLCAQHDESINHQLIQCPYSRTVWHSVAQELDLSFPMSQVDLIIVEWWDTMHNSTPCKQRKKVNALLSHVMFSIWKERATAGHSTKKHHWKAWWSPKYRSNGERGS